MILRWRGEVLMHAIPCWIVAGHHVVATGRAYRIEHIELLKIGALASELVEILRLQPRMSMTREIAPAPVVGEDAVGLQWFSSDQGWDCQK